jgi:CPA1 family monovalent cation:H+ antiporter
MYETAVVHGVFVCCLFLLGIAAIEHYFRKSVLPAICWVLLAGIVYGVAKRLAPNLPAIWLNPSVILFVFLPLLVFDSSRKLKWKQLKAVGLEAGGLATVGVITSMFLMGLPFAVMANIPVIHGLLFGVVLSATDPVAVTAVFERFPFPERLRTLIEGEALLNDGTVVVVYALLAESALNGHSFTLEEGFLGFLPAVLGAVLTGLVFGVTGSWLIKSWHVLHDRFLGALLPLITVYLAFGITQYFLEWSGVIAVMTATLVLASLRRRKETDSNDSRVDRFFDYFWDFLNDLINAVLFFLLGAEMAILQFDLPIWILPAALVVMLIARAATVYGGAGLLRITGRKQPWSWQHVLNLAGLRGALAVALILMLPRTYAYRQLFLCTAFVMILFTLIVNTLVMQAYLKRRGPLPT